MMKIEYRRNYSEKIAFSFAALFLVIALSACGSNKAASEEEQTKANVEDMSETYEDYVYHILKILKLQGGNAFEFENN
ncbi:uncharacterized lipoprotein YehR (DUF1307 family) [Scopulibacillus daqui]|uniref:Uncharacterized lipoprotein YehR (DUF1307 family) n=1 Tax=Scopulibacillus daqui TaxID=1469162 RepID=A0ABS2Q250_9BACL|nr:hypothetical protein [Scopulibacillus daqui]MBM7645622.1 uncharacterized lipoprotein YehR (DUF1307 family) [Scopulibacillus daqui]